MNFDLKTIPKLHPTQDGLYVPLNHTDANLQTITAEPWFNVSDKPMLLEGLSFDRNGENLFFCEAFGGTVFKLNIASEKLDIIQEPKGYGVAATKVHKDGRVFICSLGDALQPNSTQGGGVFAVQPDGSGYEVILDPEQGYHVDDIAFDKKGGFYFTDFKGGATFPTGGVYYVSPDYKTVTPIVKNLAIANGVAMCPNYKNLWITEVAGNRVFYVELLEDGVTIAPFGCSTIAHLTGHLGPDSCCVDADGNLYIAMVGQGRMLVLNPKGYPIAQILIPEAAKGDMLLTTHLAFVPKSDQAIICSSNGVNGAKLYTARGLAQYHTTYQYL